MMPPPEYSRRIPEAPLELGDRDEAPGDAPLHILQGQKLKIAIERSHAGMERASVVFAPKRFGDE
jgi:hypothetical protein